MKSNKYVPVGMLFLILAIILNVVSNVSDLVIGILYGISIAVLIIGLFNSRNKCCSKQKQTRWAIHLDSPPGFSRSKVCSRRSSRLCC